MARVSTAEEVREVAEAGVRMFHTARPDKTLKWLKENGWRQPRRGGADWALYMPSQIL